MTFSTGDLASFLATASSVLVGCGTYYNGSSWDAGPAPPPPITAACTAEATTLATVPGLRSDLLAMDESALYVVSTDASGIESLHRVPKSGAAPQLLASKQSNVGGLAVGAASLDDSGGALYWTTGAGDPQQHGAIWKVTGVGVAPALVVANRTSPGPLLVGAAHVYWAEAANPGAPGEGAAIVWAPLAGGHVTTWQVLPGRRVPGQMVFEPGQIAWSSVDAAGMASNVASATLPLSFSAVWEVDTRAGAPPVVAAGRGVLFLGAADGVTVVQANGLGQRKVPTSGPVRHLQGNDEVVFMIDTGLHALLAALPDESAGPPRRLASDVADGSIGFDAECVYFADQATQSLRMVHR